MRIIFSNFIRMIIAALLFLLLSPGVLLTLPPVGKKVFMSGQTSLQAVVVHAAVFAAVLYSLKKSGLLAKREGFAGITDPTTVMNLKTANLILSLMLTLLFVLSTMTSEGMINGLLYIGMLMVLSQFIVAACVYNT